MNKQGKVDLKYRRNVLHILCADHREGNIGGMELSLPAANIMETNKDNSSIIDDLIEAFRME